MNTSKSNLEKKILLSEAENEWDWIKDETTKI